MPNEPSPDHPDADHPSGEAENHPEQLWEAVSDLHEPDVPAPLDDIEESSTDETWAAVDDLNEEDCESIDPLNQEQTPPDPWSNDEFPNPLAALPDPPPPVVVPHDLQMPPMSEWRDSTSEKPQLAWRGIARVLSPELGSVVYVADPSRAESRLLVASWEPSAGETLTSIGIRLADDGALHEAPASRTGNDLVEAQIELGGKTLALHLKLEVGRDERGLRLGRDILAGAFLIDPAGDEV
ncbi:MAG: hypothetical protein CMP23_11930 [Rickettsiales bacterium]|nr:hypothetical protein [Rickettsiales bacterium]|tara:strand:- start:3749 stop:4465 length:717 start_codon:yes stop_codon:yes gene_type:complete